MNSSAEKKLGVILQYSQMALSILISFIYTPIMLRILSQSQYGIYNLANSIISYLSLLSLGFGASYIRFYSRYKKGKNTAGIKRLNGLFLIAFLVIGTVALVCGLFFSQNTLIFFNDTYTTEDLRVARVLMIFMSLNLALSFPTSVFTSYVTSQEKFVFQKLLNMVKTVASPFFTLPVLLLGYGSIGMVIVTTVITVCVDMANIFFCIFKLKMGFDFHRPDFKLLKEIAVFSSFIALNQVVDQINWATDKVVLGKVCSSAAVAVYAIGSQINTYYLQFSTAISGVFVPQVHRIVSSDKDEKSVNRQLTDIFTKVGRVQFIIIMLILTGFTFFGKYFISKWVGEGYENAYYVALLLIAPASMPLIQNLGLEIQRAKNMHQFRSFVYLGMAILNVGISIFFAKRWGEVGAAFGTTISLVLANGLVMNIFYHKKIGIDIVYFWREMAKFIPALIAPVCMGILLNVKACKGLFDFAIRILVYIVVYTLSFYFIGMNGFEKKQVNKILRKVKILKQ
jgi:O-antigen/teichoic acid export membrane protein